jgi:hypothetical protein
MDPTPRPAGTSTEEERADTRLLLGRRGFLLGAGAAVVGGVAIGPAAVRRVRAGPPVFDRDATPGFLPHAELDTIVSLLDVLVSPAHRVERSENVALVQAAAGEIPGVGPAWIEGARLLDRATRVSGFDSYVQAPPSVREAIVEVLIPWRYSAPRDGDARAFVSRVSRRLELVLLPETRRRFRELVVRDILTRFHRRHGWRMTGYRNHPGMPGQPFEYATPPERVHAARGAATKQGTS